MVHLMELSWVLQLPPLKGILMASLMVYLMGYHWNEKMELHWDLQMGMQMDFNLVLMKELSWVLQLAPLKDIMTSSLIFHLLGSHWDDKIELNWGLHMELQTGLTLGLMK